MAQADYGARMLSQRVGVDMPQKCFGAPNGLHLGPGHRPPGRAEGQDLEVHHGHARDQRRILDRREDHLCVGEDAGPL